MDLLGAPLVRPLRIALVTEVADTGLGLLLESLAQGLAVRGHHVHLIYSGKRADPNIIARLRQGGVTLKAIAMRRRPGLADLAAVWQLRRYLLENGPFDIIHGHSSKGGAVARLAGIGLEGARLYTPHAFYTLASNLKIIERALYGFAERRLSRLCQRLIVSSRTEFDHALGLGITAEKLAIVPNGIKPGDLDPPRREELGVPADACLVGFVGRLEPQKAPDIALEAFAWAHRRNPNIRLAMLGEGAMRRLLEAQAAKLGIAGKIIWLGQKPARRYLASFDLLFMPSRYEGFSLMPLEAMNAALPVLASPVGGIAESVTDGETGYVRDTVPGFGAAILTLAADPALRRAMGLAAHTRLRRFSPERMVGAIEQIYATEARAAYGDVKPLTFLSPIPMGGSGG